MRARNIKPGLFKDEELATLPIEARYLFPGLWMLADCCGRLEDRPRWIKSEIYPYDDLIGAARIHELLQLLHNSGFIQRYTADRKSYIQVVNFERHQNPHKQEKEKGSQIPKNQMVDVLPVYNGTKPELVPVETGVNTVVAQPESESLPESVPVETGTTLDDSGLLITDSLIHDSLIADCGNHPPALCVVPPREKPTPEPRSRDRPEEPDPAAVVGEVPMTDAEVLREIGWTTVRKAKADQIEGIMRLKEESLTDNPDLNSLYMIRARLWWFEEFWLGYWNKSAKIAARIAYFEHVTTLDLHERIMDAVAAQSPTMLGKPEEKRPHGATWINGERWEDQSELFGENATT